MRALMTCVCGSTLEVKTWLRDVDVTSWHDLHLHCVVAWQREHGLATTVKTPESDA